MSGKNNYNDANDDAKFRKLFIGGLHYETTQETLKQYFNTWGEIVDCIVMKHPLTKKSRGFGFITYKTAEMLDDAQNNRPHKIDNREIDTKRAMPRGESNESQSSVNKIFVGGLKDAMSEDDIREVFSRFGKIEKLETLNDKNTGKRKGFCFITFEDFDSVDKCVLRQRISVGGKSVEVKKAVPKDVGIGGDRSGFGGANRRNSNNGYGNQENMGYPGMERGGDPQGCSGGYPGYGGRNQDGYQGYGGGDVYQGYDGDNGGGGYQGSNGGGGYQGYGGRNQGGSYQGYDGGNGSGGYHGGGGYLGENGGGCYQGFGNGNQGDNFSDGYQGFGDCSGYQGGNGGGGYQGYGGGYSSGIVNSVGLEGLFAGPGSNFNNAYYNSGSGSGGGPVRSAARFAKKGTGPYGTGYGR